MTNLAIPANTSIGYQFTLDLDAELIAQSFGDMEEYYGYVIFENVETTLRLPFYFVPRTYTLVTELDKYTEFEVNNGLWICPAWPNRAPGFQRLDLSCFAGFR